MTDIKDPFTILVVDDDHEDLEIFCEAIKLIDKSIKCLIAYNGKEALQLLRSLVVLPKMIFLDHNMPQMDGKKCLEMIKSDEQLKRIPVMMYSTFFSAEDAANFKESGAAILKKQIDFSDIVKHIAAAIAGFYPEMFTSS